MKKEKLTAKERREYGDRILHERECRKLTQQEMAKMIGVSHTSYRRAEEARDEVSRKLMRQIMIRMNIPDGTERDGNFRKSQEAALEYWGRLSTMIREYMNAHDCDIATAAVEMFVPPKDLETLLHIMDRENVPRVQESKL